MNCLLSDQFSQHFGNSYIYRNVSSNCKMAVALERILHVQEVFCEVLLKENEGIKNDFDFLC